MNRLALAIAMLLALSATLHCADAQRRGGGRIGGGMRSRPSMPSRSMQRPSTPSGGFNFNGDFSNRTPVDRPSNPIAGAPGDRPGRAPGSGVGSGNRPDRPPGGTRPPIQPPVPPAPNYGWNGGVIWAPAPYYYGGGFWGPYAWGVTTAVVLGSVENEETNEEVKSYEVSPDSPGAKVLSAYGLQQVECKSEGLVTIFGPENSVVCASPNELVSAGVYDLNVQDLTIYSRA
jgi:hypothetical protein